MDSPGIARNRIVEETATAADYEFVACQGLPGKPNAWREIVQGSVVLERVRQIALVDPCRNHTRVIARQYIACQRCSRTTGSRHLRIRYRRGQGGPEVTEAPRCLCWEIDDLPTKSEVEGQPRRDLVIVLNEAAQGELAEAVLNLRVSRSGTSDASHIALC